MVLSMKELYGGKGRRAMNYSLGDLVDRLSIVNNKIFALENDIRSGKLDVKNAKDAKQKASIEREVGRRAMMIRDINRERVALKNAINDFQTRFEHYRDYKVNHGSGKDEPKFGDN